MAFIVIFDANVLYPDVLRDVLIRVARTGLVRARWSEMILDEAFENIKKKNPQLDPKKLARTRDLMNKAVPDCLVHHYEPLINSIEGLPDPDDRHVVAAAIRAGAQAIVTHNIKDLPNDVLAQWDIEAKTPDAFLQDIYHVDGGPDAPGDSRGCCGQTKPCDDGQQHSRCA